MPVFTTFSTTTGADLAALITFGGHTSQQTIEIEQIALALEDASTLTNNFVITRKSHRNGFVDSILLDQNMTTVADVIYRPENGPYQMNGKDRLTLNWTADKRWCLEVFYKS